MKHIYYTVAEAARMLGIKEQTLRNYITEGKIKSIVKYNSTVISRANILEYLDKVERKI